MSPKLKGQENQRRPEIWVDQHKRQYFVNLDILSGDPIDINRKGWRAPVNPVWAKGLFMPPLGDSEIVKLMPQRERHLKGYQLFIDYDVWLQKIDKAESTRRSRIASIAADLSGGNALKLVANPTRDLEAYVGPPPFPPREIVEAMRAGNKWALGFSDQIPAKAVKIMDEIKLRVMASKAVRLDEDDQVRDPFADEMLVNPPDSLSTDPSAVDPLGEDEDDDPEAAAIRKMYEAEGSSGVATIAQPRRGGRKGVRSDDH